MDVLFFNQYFTSTSRDPDIILANMPINLLCLASYLKEKGILSKIYELGILNRREIKTEGDRVRCGISDKEIMCILEKEKPKIIGLGCMYSRHYIDVLSIAKLIKEYNKDIQVVLGGNHATAFWNMALKNDVFDFIVKGEGEITFYELCEKVLSGKKDFYSITGLAYKDINGSIITAPPRDLIKNLDDLVIDYSLVDVLKYANITKNSPFLMRYPALGVISSRGCPNNCIYCTIKIVWGRTWRAKSAKKTVDELELLKKRYGIQEFAFLDDSASLNKKRWLEICDEIIRRKLNIRWTTPNGIAHWTLDKPVLNKMKKSGCYRVTFGIESGNVETRKFIGKPYSLKQAQELIQHANKIGMWTICTNILGFPYENRKSIQNTVNFAKKSGTDFATFFLLAPHVTSEVYNYFKKEGLVDFDSIFNDNIFDEDAYEKMNKTLNDDGVPTKYFSAAELKKIQIYAYRSFIVYRAFSFFNLLRIIRKINSKEDFFYMLKLFFVGLKILVKTFYKNTTKTILYD